MRSFTVRLFGIPLFSIDSVEYVGDGEEVVEELVVSGDVNSHFGLVVHK